MPNFNKKFCSVLPFTERLFRDIISPWNICCKVGVQSVDIADNIIRNKLKNVYFIWGRGKTTVADILKSKYGCFVFGTDEARDRNMAYACPKKLLPKPQNISD